MAHDDSTRNLRYDITGQRFGRLVAVSYEPGKWLCRCDCGKTTLATGGNLRSGNTTSCGCLRDENLSTGRLRRTHGMSYTRVFTIWSSMKQRCYDPNAENYYLYGERGITICDRWLTSFENFYADMGEPPAAASIDRIDNDGPYSPENCRWSTRTEQNRNTRRNVSVEFNGVIKVLSKWCEELNLNYKVTHQRINRDGWSVQKALSTPTSLPYKLR